MNLRSSSFLVPAVLAAGCIVTKPIGDADSDSATSTAGDTAPDTDDLSGPGMTSNVDTSGGDPDGDPLRADCAEQDWGQTVGGGGLNPLGFPVQSCNPRSSGEAFGYKCCSTDPATADGSLPSYEHKEITDGGTPIYADLANDAGRWGMCIRTTDIPMGAGLLGAGVENCPIPCNPTWSASDTTTVCGAGRVCCQTTELGAKDCVQEDGVWRPVTGNDIGNANVVPSTVWNNVAHDTHQDPNGTVCLAVSGGQQTPEFAECIRSLSVANQRGFCMALGAGQFCPGDAPGYVDACEAMNG